MSYTFAVLIPIKINGDGLSAAQYGHLSKLAQFLDSNHEVKVYFGIDEDKLHSSAIHKLKDMFNKFTTTFKSFDLSNAGKICYYWNDLAKAAGDDGCDFFCLLGDDTELHNSKWIDEVINEFKVIKNDLNLPEELFGFGCVALYDRQCHGFPTFPVVHRLHLQLNDGELFSNEFINQDGDPYLFQLYRRFGASRFAKNAQLTNHIGGVQLNEDTSYEEPRYQRIHINWQNCVEESFKNFRSDQLLKNISPFITIDVIVPSYRCQQEFIERILSLKSSINNVSVNFIVIIDNPNEGITWLNDIANKRFDVRVRVNEKNMGASHSRNVGMIESAAEWILFLDDDVIPDPSIIDAYVEHGVNKIGNNYEGMVGFSELPNKPNEIFPTAVHFSGVSFFWRAATEMKIVPWGITANLMVRRSSAKKFNTVFLKTGGGEDIDFCLRLDKHPLLSVPQAKIVHPWWKNGNRCYEHFYNWSYSDGILQDMYPQYNYITWPNFTELFCIVFIISVLASLKYGYSYLVVILTGIPMFLVDMALDLYKHQVILHKESYSKGIIRILAILESTCIKATSERGRLIGHLSRMKFHNFCYRFDWFCGDPKIVADERRSGFYRFIGYLLALVISFYLFDNWF